MRFRQKATMLPAVITLCTHIWIWVSRCNKPSKKRLAKVSCDCDVSLRYMEGTNALQLIHDQGMIFFRLDLDHYGHPG